MKNSESTDREEFIAKLNELKQDELMELIRLYHDYVLHNRKMPELR